MLFTWLSLEHNVMEWRFGVTIGTEVRSLQCQGWNGNAAFMALNAYDWILCVWLAFIALSHGWRKVPWWCDLVSVSRSVTLRPLSCPLQGFYMIKVFFEPLRLRSHQNRFCVERVVWRLHGGGVGVLSNCITGPTVWRWVA